MYESSTAHARDPSTRFVSSCTRTDVLGTTFLVLLLLLLLLLLFASHHVSIEEKAPRCRKRWWQGLCRHSNVQHATHAEETDRALLRIILLVVVAATTALTTGRDPAAGKTGITLVQIAWTQALRRELKRGAMRWGLRWLFAELRTL